MNSNFDKFILGIDATNIRSGGGVTHLIELLNINQISQFGFSKIIIWGSEKTLSLIAEKDWIQKEFPFSSYNNFFFRFYWQTFLLKHSARKCNCDLILVPGSTYLGNFRPFVTISQNMLPFENKELKRYGFSLMSLKLLILKLTQSLTFVNANGLIFLSEYAQKKICNLLVLNPAKTIIIPHGINNIFHSFPKIQYDLDHYSINNKFKIIYVSKIDMYKHQWNVVKALRDLYYDGYPIEVTFIGGSYPSAFFKFNKEVKKDPNYSNYINYVGELPYDKINTEIRKADLFLFASTCENLPNILLEGMASGLPILSSKFGPMQEVLYDSCLYFNPENYIDIKKSILEYILSKELRSRCANKTSILSKNYNWENSSKETFSYLYNTAKTFYGK